MSIYIAACRVCLIMILMSLLQTDSLVGQSNSDDTEVFPDDLYLDNDAIDKFEISRFTIPNKRLHLIMSSSRDFSSNASQFEKRFGAPSSNLISLNGMLLGVEYQLSPKNTIYVHASLPQKLSSAYNGNDPSSNFAFATKHTMSYGKIISLGMFHSLKRYSRLDFGLGGGAEIQGVSMKSELMTNKNAIPNSVLLVTNNKQSKYSAGIFGSATLDYYVTRNISVQSKFQFHIRPSTAEIKEQKVIRRANLYFGTYDYLWHTFSGLETSGIAVVFEIGARWHLF